MEFETYYNKQQIISIFNKYTIPYNFINSMESNAFISKLKNDKVILFKAGVLGLGGGQCPLVIKLIESNNNIILDCKFKNTISQIISFCLFICFAWFMVLELCIFNSNFDLWGKIITTFFALIWTLFCFAFFILGDRIFFNKRRIAVIRFLETNLYARRIS
jgi:hypothetical protein